MKNKSAIILVTLILMSAINFESLLSQDWPQFRGPSLDNRVKGFTAPASWPSELKQQWRVPVGKGDASPVLAEGKIYLHTRQGSEEVILCLDANTGKELWRSSYPTPPVTGAASSHPGPRSTPTVANGKLYVYGVSGILSCLDVKTGKMLWRKEYPANGVPEFATSMSPLVTDGRCIVLAGDEKNGMALALDAATGDEKWRVAGIGAVYSSASVMNTDGIKQIVVGAEKTLTGINLADGKLLWQVETPPGKWCYSAPSPVVTGTTVFSTGQGTGTRAFRIEKQGNKYSAMEIWSNTKTGAQWNTPVLRDGFLYGFSNTRRIFCINASDGQTAWTDDATNSDFATLFDCGKILIGLPSTGNLIVFSPDSKAYKEIARYKVAATPVYAFPVISGDKIYVKDADSLILYKVE
jgi:outer membrane protein assembly factor BamB